MTRRRMHKPRKIRLKSNEFWGFRSGTITKKGERVFLIARPSTRTTDNKGPMGWKFLKRWREYRNPKLSRQSAKGFAVFPTKGRKQAIGRST